MIDYEKLKKAHELGVKYTTITENTFTIKSSFSTGFIQEYYELYVTSDNFKYNNIDDLIKKLEELTEPPIWIIKENKMIKTSLSELQTKHADHNSGYWTSEDEAHEYLKTIEPRSKYKIGDELWFTIGSNRILNSHVLNTPKNSYEYYVLESFHCRSESELYPTKIALIQAQIDYWLDRMGKTVFPASCEHDNNGKARQGFRCKKCGELY